MESRDEFFDPEQGGALVREKHSRFALEMDEQAAYARIPVDCVWRTTKGILTDEEMDLLNTRPAGIVYVGAQKAFDPGINTKFEALAGLYLRNFKVAKVRTMSELEEDSDFEVEVLLIPDFYLVRKEPQWVTAKRAELAYNLIRRRRAEGVLVILYVEDPKAFREDYGDHTSRLIEDYYKPVVA